MPLNGYARVPRALLESDWSDEPETFLVLLRLIIGANFKETDWRGVHLMPGEIIISLSSLSSQNSHRDKPSENDRLPDMRSDKQIYSNFSNR